MNLLSNLTERLSGLDKHTTRVKELTDEARVLELRIAALRTAKIKAERELNSLSRSLLLLIHAIEPEADQTEEEQL